ncbi:MAG: class I SAM-dependent methyltransferase [Actinomycetota bacterium]|nr:class I SAM-dependent methyltransferase [Actinomycetota bacterium]
MFLRENEIGSKVAPWLEPGQTVLDLGAGTGFISRWLRDHVGVRPTLTDVVSYRNREGSLEFLGLDDPFQVPVADGSFDVVMLLFVFHHVDRLADQERLLDEAVRIARSRIVVLEDTPGSRLDLAFNKAWDWVLNQRHRVPTPFTFRRTEEWVELFKARDLSIVRTETYRPRWPTLMTYPHSVFVLDR